ncbi:MAG TPA: alanine--tRNA ligase-related protein, partial [Spirochaetota bacterium]|nr:alanine--tRNA ligase-related protein [Spirochaetota bacterium]
MKVRDLRKSFIDYFVSKQHKHVHSSSLLPKDDPTLLFTTAGMVQFKAMFAG